MVTRNWLRTVGLCAVVGVLTGCGPNWEQLAAAQERELQVVREYHQLIQTVTARPSGNAGEQAWVAYETRMAAFQADANELMPNTYGQTLNYVARYEDRQLQWASLGSDWLQFGIREWRQAARSYGSKVVINANRKAKGRPGEEGAISASGDTNISDLYIVQGRSQGAWDSNRLAQGKDAQYQDGNGVQGQAFSDPPNFQQNEAPITLDSSFAPSAGF